MNLIKSGIGLVKVWINSIWIRVYCTVIITIKLISFCLFMRATLYIII